MKKWVKIILIVLVILVVILLISWISLILYNDYQDSKCKKVYDEEQIASLTFLKCLSLCPEELSESYNKTFHTVPKVDCNDFCSDKIVKLYLSEPYSKCEDRFYYCKEGSGISIGFIDFLYVLIKGHGLICSEDNIMLTCPTEYHGGPYNCYYKNLLKGNFSDREILIGCYHFNVSDVGKCLGEEVQKYSYIVDLSDYQLGDYPKYDVMIPNLSCKNSSVDITIEYTGDYPNTKTVFLLFGGGRSFRLEKGPIANGETKTYSLSYNVQDIQAGMDLVEVSLVLLQNGKEQVTDTLDRKSCQ